VQLLHNDSAAAQGNTYDYDTYDDLEKATTEAWTDPELFMLPITNGKYGPVTHSSSQVNLGC
jgi:hypothetical protein